MIKFFKKLWFKWRKFQFKTDTNTLEMREKLADLCHRQWSGWMTYLYGKCSSNPDGTLTIPAWGGGSVGTSDVNEV